MARTFRRLILWLLAALVLLALLAAAALWWFIDPDRLRLRLQAEASAMLGREVQLQGPLRWNFAALLAIRSGPGSVANAPGFGPGPLASWGDIQLGLAWQPLFRREVRIDRITVDGLVLDLQQDAAGNTNWRFELPEAGGDPAPLLRIGSLRLREADLRYTDAGDGTGWRLREASLQVALPEDLDAPELRFGTPRLQGLLTGGPLVASGVRLAFDATAIRMAMPRIEIEAFALEWAEASLRGDLQIASLDPLALRGHVDARTPSLRESLAGVGVQPPATADPTTFGRLQLQAEVAHDIDGTSAKALAMQFDDSRVTGEATLAALVPLSARFDLAADRVVLDRYLAPDAVPDEPFTLPLDALRSLDVKGVLRIDSAVLEGGQARQVRIDVE